MAILTFEKAIQKCIDKERHLLLGNGFSIGFSPDAFKYDAIYNASGLPNEILEIFNLFNETRDYELVISKLKDSMDIARYLNQKFFAKELSNHINLIKKDLVYTISNKHPKSQFSITDRAKNNTATFLFNFKNIFTLNYDLLLYWVLMHSKSKLYDDGFTKRTNYDCIWKNSRRKQNIFYLHGALHLFYDEFNTYKIKYKQKNNKTILEQIKEYINRDVFPLIITEGNSYDKLRWIRRNSYLNFCFSKLSKIRGVLFIHGHSLNETDQHIFDAINDNYNIKELYISIHKKTEDPDEKRAYAKSRFGKRKGNDKIKLHFYNAEKVKLW